MKKVTPFITLFIILFFLSFFSPATNRSAAKISNQTSNLVLTPGSTEKDLHFCWYSQTKGTPAVQIRTHSPFSTPRIFKGTSKKIKRSNGTYTYISSNRVSISDFFQENTKYYYQYTDDISSRNPIWSSSYLYETNSQETVDIILAGDPQIGASGNIKKDTDNWKKTLEVSRSICPTPDFIFSVGDQVNAKTDHPSSHMRELQYGGLLSPTSLRNIPFATAIGNHDSRSADYRYHFYNPNTQGNYGATSAGCNYYFTRGNALFIVLNSNNRNIKKHRIFMKKAIKHHSDAKWRIVVFHHDIYGSGAMHANRSSANLRTIFAPLMDKFHIDLVLNGHDHTYARSYSMLDGVAIKNTETTLVNPIGTTYISLGTSSGSKQYGIAKHRQYYVAERINYAFPSYSYLTIEDSRLTIRTYNHANQKIAKDFTIRKTKEKENPLQLYKKSLSLKRNSYTKSSYKIFQKAKNLFQKQTRPILSDSGARKISKKYRCPTDPLSYYGYAAGSTKVLPKGFSALLDKTTNQKIKLSSQRYEQLWYSLKNSILQLKRK